MIERREDLVLKAATGLESGVVASGSTCGVATGGALGLALMYDDLLQEGNICAKAGVLSLAGEYLKWFKQNFGTTLCRERSRVDWNTTWGHIRYFLPGDRLGKCFWHIRGAIRHLYTYQGKDFPQVDIGKKEIQGEPIHCAQAVLKGIRDRTGQGDPLLERLSFVFNGGVGLQGGVCGALAGAIMGINLQLGMNIRDISYFHTLKSCAIGHINLLLDKPIGQTESFGVGKEILKRFREEAGSTECHAIVGKEFSGWTDFQEHVLSSEKCDGLIKLATNEASKAIEGLA
jgi:C_GCAxxG_C_C family probable redox protein